MLGDVRMERFMRGRCSPGVVDCHPRTECVSVAGVF
jgi:hypothetical protein